MPKPLLHSHQHTSSPQGTPEARMVVASRMEIFQEHFAVLCTKGGQRHGRSPGVFFLGFLFVLFRFNFSLEAKESLTRAVACHLTLRTTEQLEKPAIKEKELLNLHSLQDWHLPQTFIPYFDLKGSTKSCVEDSAIWFLLAQPETGSVTDLMSARSSHIAQQDTYPVRKSPVSTASPGEPPCPTQALQQGSLLHWGSGQTAGLKGGKVGCKLEHKTYRKVRISQNTHTQQKGVKGEWIAEAGELKKKEKRRGKMRKEKFLGAVSETLLNFLLKAVKFLVNFCSCGISWF